MPTLEYVCPVCGGRVKAREGKAQVQTFCRDCGALVMVETDTGAVKKRRLKLGDYHLRYRIAEGGMGTVYRGHKIDQDEAWVALKVMHQDAVSDEDYLARFHREAAIGSEVRHPNLLHIHGAEQAGDRHFMVMDLIDGESLEDRIIRDRGVPWRDACQIVVAVSKGAAALAQKGIVHRDIKAANVLLCKNGDPVLGDYGLAKRLQGGGGREEAAAMTMMGDNLGTPVFMAPEQVMDSSSVTPATDVYGLAITLYHAIAGRAPYDERASAIKVMEQVLKEPPEPISNFVKSVPKAVSAVIDWGLAKEPAHRPPGPQGLIDALVQAQAEPSNDEAIKKLRKRGRRLSSRINVAPGSELPPSSGGSNAVLIAAVVVVVVIATAVAVWLAS